MKRKNLKSLTLTKSAVSNLATRKSNAIKGGWAYSRIWQQSCAPLFCDTK